MDLSFAALSIFIDFFLIRLSLLQQPTQNLSALTIVYNNKKTKARRTGTNIKI